jgi:putative transposase
MNTPIPFNEEEFRKKYMEAMEMAQKCSTVEEIGAKDGPLAHLFKDMIQGMLNQEMTEHLGYEHNDARSKRTTNSRNGYTKKTLKTDGGKVEIDVPRDRQGEFEPQIVPKNKTRTSDLEKKIISMYAKGMTTKDISEHISDLYLGAEVSSTFISQVTEKVLPIAKEWQSRGLDKVYPIVFFDAIHYKVREDGKTVSKAVYVALAINMEGRREVLGFYVGNHESSKFWMQVFTDLQNRGVQDILIACVDGLKGLPEAISAVFPRTEIQLCIVHQIRNSLKYVGSKNQKEFAQDLKLVYTAATEEQALLELDKLEDKWEDLYPVVIKSWRLNWPELATFFQYTAPIRKMIYTTNIIEGFHRQLRKVSKNRGSFPNDDSLLKLLYLAMTEAEKRWTMPRQGWAEMIGQLAIHFEGRVPLEI